MNRLIISLSQRLGALLLCFLLLTQAVAQVPAPPTPFQGATLSILNQGNVGSDFFFDLYLRATTSTPGNLYLANADFVLTFNNANFSSPVLSKVSGFCNFVPNNTGNAALCQALYNASTTVSLSGNELRINLNTLVATDMTELDDNIANINTSAGTHRLGRFKISGISIPTGTAGLAWKPVGPGVFTDVYYYATDLQQYRAALTFEAPEDAALPLELLQFNARAQQRFIALDWQSAAEHNFDGYELQRSTDGSSFEKITWIPGKGGVSNNDYRYEDHNADPGILYYYRLKMLDTDGVFTYSAVRSVQLGKTWDKPVITPNPTEGFCSISFVAPKEGSGTLEITDPSGKKVAEQNIQFGSGSNNLQLDLNGVAPGTYFVQLFVEGAAGQWNVRVVVAR